MARDAQRTPDSSTPHSPSTAVPPKDGASPAPKGAPGPTGPETPEAPGAPGAPSARVTRMGTESIPRLITEFAVPSVVGMVVNGSYNIIDSMFLGHAMGEIGLSAVTVAMPTMIVFMALAMLVGAGGNALAALRLGEGNRDAAERSLGNVVTLSLVLWVLVAALALNPTTIDAVLTLSSATDDVRPYARTFIQILCYGFILQCVGMGVNNFIRTAGAPNRALGTMVIGLVAATGFNYLFVILLNWGVAGSALATLAGQACSCVAVLWYFLFTKGVPLRLRLSCMRPSRRVVGTILAFGFPSFALQAGSAIVNFLLNYQLVKYGALSPLGAEDALASIGVVQRIGMFTVMPIVGVSVAIQPLLGYNYGARKLDRVRATLWLGIAGATVFCVVEWVIIMLLAGPIVAAFGISHDGLVDFTAFALRIWLLLLPFIGFQIVGSNYFQATGQPAKAIFLTLTRQIIFLVPLVLFLPDLLPPLVPSLDGLDALYVAAPVSDFLAIFTVGLFLVWEMRRLRRMEATKPEAAARG